ncbi:hypothetical protein JZ751_018331 [Albula glossodonta]|uniref:5-hydroxyisourate hydrolase n=1 Tax=Albula glossodonta TaxID=121402 RepID=A0A8T2NMJ2_9TELE|nr:hypothetical protein JZ751_018331 [Albula glossodonta]
MNTTRLRRIKDHLLAQNQCSAMATAQGSPITTHVLNTGEGVPGARMGLSLHRLDSHMAVWSLITTGEAFIPGMYKMRFETGEYFESLGQTCFYPYVEIVFTITDAAQKFHLPLLLSRFSYSTYRGS